MSEHLPSKVVNINAAHAKQADAVLPAEIKIKPKMEQAIRMYACGQCADQKAAAAIAGVHPNRFSIVLNSSAGQAIVNSVRNELEFKYKAMFKKFIQVVGDAMDHADPAVALAGASLYAKTSVGMKHTVELTAEDVVQQIMNGTYVPPQEGQR